MQGLAGVLSFFTLLCSQQSLAADLGLSFSWVVCSVAEIIEEILLEIQKSKLPGRKGDRQCPSVKIEQAEGFQIGKGYL